MTCPECYNTSVTPWYEQPMNETIREIKSYRYFQIAPEDMKNLDDFEFVFSKDKVYKINIYTGETIWQQYRGVFIDHQKMVEGIPDEMDVLVDISVYRAWLETRDDGIQKRI